MTALYSLVSLSQLWLALLALLLAQVLYVTSYGQQKLSNLAHILH